MEEGKDAKEKSEESDEVEEEREEGEVAVKRKIKEKEMKKKEERM